MADRWVYRVVTMLSPVSDGGILRTEDALNGCAAEGWELVSTAEGCDGWIVYFLKRPAPPEDVFGDNAWSATRDAQPAPSERGAAPQAP